MKLTQEQIKAYDEEGYILLPSLFSQQEAALMKSRLPALYQMNRDEVVKEKNGVVRTVFAAHTFDEVFARVASHPRLIDPARQLLNSEVYMHQFKINAKAAFNGDIWQWHQDFGTWHQDDGMPEARAMNVAIFLDDVNEFNGPLMFIPRSHKEGRLDASHDLTTTSYPLWTLDNAKVSELVEQGGIVAPKGVAGTVLIFQSTLVHASSPNLSPWDRNTLYVTTNSVENAIRKFQRPDYIAHRDFTPIQTLDDACLDEFQQAVA
ncbi:phytanoyl-CoA dioxygenase family protein [Pseudomonas fluorescens]|uniref:Ectoine dioxygenase n=1 Tax=Pseudomonas fluorescens TaxID=294 RepID=A0A5E7FW62_PSEFL|nr:phytanoyl-CoA dioxygenase family protein [Pseudomonas fluorescens]VVO43921.1 Ectoine dioxygenase [Pseudomonas fluorescens]VVQ10809.1 Ectoine dioxygenase [Pseudomonas fluorescens]